MKKREGWQKFDVKKCKNEFGKTYHIDLMKYIGPISTHRLDKIYDFLCLFHLAVGINVSEVLALILNHWNLCK